jgi:hypothetical protein
MKKIIFISLFLIVFQSSAELVPKKLMSKVAQAHQKMSLLEIRNLMHKLYLRNPKELKKGERSFKNVEKFALQTLNEQEKLEELNYTKGLDSVALAFEKTYKGDRILALIYGMTSILMDAYKNKATVDADYLVGKDFYELARNFEIINWKLNHNKQTNGKLYLLSNSLKGGKDRNLSFEHLFGKLISHQEMMVEMLRLYHID